MKKYIFTLLVLIVGLNFPLDVAGAEEITQSDDQEEHTSERSPNSKWMISIDCNKEGCSTYAQTDNKKVWIIKPNDPSPFPSVTWLSNEVAELYFSCGMGCGGTMYFSTVHGVSPVFEQNLATDIKRNLIITLESSDKHGTPAFFVRNIFKNKGSVVSIIKRNIEMSFFREGIEASFNSDRTITIHYTDSKTKKDRIETIVEPFH
jgi:hypothetical protein